MPQIITAQGDTVDSICHALFGQTRGITETVMSLNPGIAELGPILPTGTAITLPEAVSPPTKKSTDLWN